MSNIRNRFVDNLILGKNTNDMFGIILIQEHLKLVNLVSLFFKGYTKDILSILFIENSN